MKIIALFFFFFMSISCMAAQVYTTGAKSAECDDPAYMPKRVAGAAEINCHWEVEFAMPKRYNKDKRIETVGSPDSLLKAELLAIKKAAKTPENLAQTLQQLQKKHSRIVFIEIPEKPIRLEAKLIFGKYNRKFSPSPYGKDTNISDSDYWRLDSMALSTTENENFKFTMDSITIGNCVFHPQYGCFRYVYSCKLNYRALDLPEFSFYLDKNPDFAKTFLESDIDKLIASKLPFVHIYSEEEAKIWTRYGTCLSIDNNLNKKKGVMEIDKVIISPKLKDNVGDIPLGKHGYWGLIKVKHNEEKAFQNLKKQIFELNKK